MGELRDSIESWLGKRKTPASQLAAFATVRAVADTCDAAIAAGQLSEAQSAFLVECASDAKAILWNNTTEMITELQARGIDTAPVVLALFASRKARVRYAAMCCIRDRTPVLLADELLARGIADADGKVVGKAAQLATLVFRKKWMVPLMYGPAKASKYVEHLLALLKHGYIAHRLHDGRYYVTVLTLSDGERARDVSAEDVQAHGMAAIVQGLQQSEAGKPPKPVEETRATG